MWQNFCICLVAECAEFMVLAFKIQAGSAVTMMTELATYLKNLKNTWTCIQRRNSCLQLKVLFLFTSYLLRLLLITLTYQQKEICVGTQVASMQNLGFKTWFIIN